MKQTAGKYMLRSLVITQYEGTTTALIKDSSDQKIFGKYNIEFVSTHEFSDELREKGFKFNKTTKFWVKECRDQEEVDEMYDYFEKYYVEINPYDNRLVGLKKCMSCGSLYVEKCYCGA